MFYKLKVTKKGFRYLGTVPKIGKDNNKDYLYLTKEELSLLNPASIEGYSAEKESIDKKEMLYKNLNKM